ncbi:MAG: VanZ family protein [Opitutae bacterium]|nr:VanZ family protein [Opitutae bacterium]
MLRALKPWLPVVLWMGVIFAVSTDLGSYQHTSRFIGPLLRWLIPDISPEAVRQVQFLVRKAAHFTEYAILALLARRAAGHSLRVAETHRHVRAAGLALLIAAGYAATDEWHQSFVPSRTASPTDVLIDTTGAGAALAAALLWRKWRATRSARRQPE